MVRAALAEVRDELAEVEVAGETYFFVPDGSAATSAAVPAVLLLPLYDELPLSYRDLAHPRPPDHPHPPGADRFVGSVVAGGADLGTWRREVRGRVVEVALDLAPSTPEELRAGAEEQARRLAAFLGRELERR